MALGLAASNDDSDNCPAFLRKAGRSARAAAVMSWFTKASYERHRRGITAGRCYCAKCGTQLRCAGTGRSLWLDGFTGGPGIVLPVAEIYCQTCDGVPAPPAYGSPIYESEIVELSLEPSEESNDA